MTAIAQPAPTIDRHHHPGKRRAEDHPAVVRRPRQRVGHSQTVDLDQLGNRARESR
jgi:hypothetical protein